MNNSTTAECRRPRRRKVPALVGRSRALASKIANAGAGKDDSRVGCHFFIKAHEAVCLESVVAGEIERPAVIDRLVPKFRFHLERTCHAAQLYDVTNRVAA